MRGFIIELHEQQLQVTQYVENENIRNIGQSDAHHRKY